MLWTRRPFESGERHVLDVEVAEDQGFTRVVARAPAPVAAAADWTCRVLVGGLKPRRVYWYRFTDESGTTIGYKKDVIFPLRSVHRIPPSRCCSV